MFKSVVPFIRMKNMADVGENILGGLGGMMDGVKGFIMGVLNIVLIPAVFIVIVLYVLFLLAAMMRVGALFVQMLIAPFYVPFVLLGDSQKVSEWILGTFAAGFTYVVQFTMFYSGLIILRFSGGAPVIIILGLGLVFSTFSVPKIMQRFGYSSGISHTFQSMSSSMGMLIMNVVRK